MKISCLALVLLAFSLAACGPGKRDDVISVSSNDAEMNAAIQEGRKTFGHFKEAFKTNPDFGGLVKVYFSDGSTDGEHMWVQPIDLTGPEMTGVLLDTPAWLTHVKSGEKVTFTMEKVSDWLYIENGKAMGAYTVRLLRNRMTEAERKDHDSRYPFSFD